MSFLIWVGVLAVTVLVVQYFRRQDSDRAPRSEQPKETSKMGRTSPRGQRASDFGVGVARKALSIPFIPLLWVGVVGFVLVQIGMGLNNWLSQPSVRIQELSFYGMNTSNFLRQAPRTISVGPLDRWVLDIGAVRGGSRHPDGYWVCPTSNLSILQGRVFESRRLGGGRYEVRFAESARLSLVQSGVSAIDVTYVYLTGLSGGRSPCTQTRSF